MERVPEAPCRWFTVKIDQKDSLQKNKIYQWSVQELHPEEQPITIPEQSTIIIFLDPALVDKLESSPRERVLSIHLPTVIFKNPLNQETLDQALIEVVLTKPDLMRHHNRVTHPVRTNSKKSIVPAAQQINQLNQQKLYQPFSTQPHL